MGVTQLSATHNRAGEILYKQIGILSIEIKIVTYTKASSVAADRDSLEVFWGDGTSEFVKRNNDLVIFAPNDVKVNFYIAEHTYPGASTYTVSFADPNRVGGILNVNYPNSIDVPFFLSTTFTLLNLQFQGLNNSAILSQPPLDYGCVNKIFVHNPGAYDLDGDSLSFELATPLMANNMPVPGYRFPNEIGFSVDNLLTINSVTGELRWDSPKIQGEYNIAIKIKEYRNGQLINVIFRDMQILIRACENLPPQISVQEEICVLAGTLIDIDVLVLDPDEGQKSRLTATGAPFVINDPAILLGPSSLESTPFTAKFLWQTKCTHISNQYYQIVFRAQDSFGIDSLGLATYKTLRIKVVAPEPLNLQTIAEIEKVKLTWDAPYICQDTDDNYFLGFSVWRKLTASNIEPDTCNPGLSKSPYVRIGFVFEKNTTQYVFLDDVPYDGNTYCYRIQAEFAKRTSTGNPFNRVEGLPSNESCIILNRNIPLITKISIVSTDVQNGEVHVRWTKPILSPSDSIQYQGPFKFVISRSLDNRTFQNIYSTESNTLSALTDTNYFDKRVNTNAGLIWYEIQYFSNGILVGSSPKASSVFLSGTSMDRSVLLSWTHEVPWNNYNYHVFKKNENNNYVLLQTTTNPFLKEDGLENGQIYCYKIEAFGTYSATSIEAPLINLSQELCLIPKDDKAPCPPTLDVKNICDRGSETITQADIFNALTWSDVLKICPDDTRDFKSYRVYFAPSESASLELIDEIESNTFLSLDHAPDSGLLGCYAVTAVDINGNESILSNKVCKDNCPLYELPNTFTPNGDGSNDKFRPRKNIFINKVDFKVFNQWGNLVFETSDPEIDWDGTSKSGIPVADGTYFYTCTVYEDRVVGVVASSLILNGYINIIRS